MYLFKEAEVHQVVLPNGRQFNKFANGQRECRNEPSRFGTRVFICFENGTLKGIERDGSERIRFVDGTTEIIDDPEIQNPSRTEPSKPDRRTGAAAGSRGSLGIPSPVATSRPSQRPS
eukprot:GHVU01156236.1.p1 GENE.GHVU01156236.1~~GHVU01156236.1.p1  ORF type:complete len:118 (-),score=20.09 GHVU01156236.1:176-529(-)